MAARSLLKSWFPTTTSPLVCNAPMFGTANASMAAAVSRAGGLGIIGAGFDLSHNSAQLANLDAELTKAASALSIKPGQHLPVAVGFITFHSSFEHILETVPPLLEKYKVAGVWLAFPQPGAHADVIQELKKKGETWGLKAFVQVGTVEAAREAVDHGADVIVAQGNDAGGHQWAQGASIVSLVPEIREMLERDFSGQDIALVAAGGIMDGRGLAAAIALGADGIVMGTKFISTKESPAPEFLKDRLISTNDGGSATIKSTTHDELQGTGFWPGYVDGRAIIGDPYNEHKAGSSLDDLLGKHKAAAAEGDHSRKIIWCGTGVGLIKDVPSCEDVVKTTLRQYGEITTRMSSS
ncbi:MAG: hypothetical protein M1822_009030 [Bathelium mastoideum]|nr:MAG: hypothetical protein M1822_009030 [Bathelium mastoideum]